MGKCEWCEISGSGTWDLLFHHQEVSQHAKETRVVPADAQRAQVAGNRCKRKSSM